MLELQRRRPHRLAGVWRVENSRSERHVECVEASVTTHASSGRPNQECLIISGGCENLRLCGARDGNEWSVVAPENTDKSCEVPGLTCVETAGQLQWSDGTVWTRDWQDEQPMLGCLGAASVKQLREAAADMNNITCAERGEAMPCGRRWLPRLVAFRSQKSKSTSEPQCRNQKSRGVSSTSFLAPLDLDTVEATISDFARKLKDNDVESADDVEAEDASDEDEFQSPTRQQVNNDDDDDEDDQIDTTQE